MILLVAPGLTKIPQFAPARAALSGVNGAVVGSLLAGAYLVGQSAFLFPDRPDDWLRLDNRLLDPYPVAITLIALCLIVRYKVNTIYLFLTAGGTALLLNWWGIHLPGAA